MPDIGEVCRPLVFITVAGWLCGLVSSVLSDQA